MKQLFALLAIFTITLGQAQWKPNFDKEDKNNTEDKKRLSYGYFLGLNYFDFKVHPDDNGINEFGRFNIESESKPGFSAGLMGKLKINNYFDLYLQPGVHFTERTLYFNHIREGKIFPNTTTGVDYVATAADSVRSIKSSYIDVPLMIQLHGDRWFNTRPYIQAGVGYAMNLQSEESSEDDNEDGVFRMKTHGFNYQIEGGVSIYFRRFKLTPSVKGIFFLNNELVADDPTTLPIWADAMKSMHTRAVMFSIKFE